MSFNNPTAVQIGMTGTFLGASYHVVGRSVLGVIDDGRSYYWNEYNLRADSGETAILVYDTSDRIAEWRWFTTFEPQTPITAAEAASKRLSDRLNLDGTEVRVTLRDHSRVYYVEGEPPEGEAVGTQADYFNAEAGQDMIVVSWTGDEVDCYHGKTISAMAVGHGFNINIPAATFNTDYTDTSPGSFSFLRTILKGFVVLLIFGLFLVPVFHSSFSFTSRAPAVVHISAPSGTLPVGGTGTLQGKSYVVVSDALVEVRDVRSIFQRHEFHLRDSDGNGALLIHGWKPGANDWCLFTLAEPAEPMTPQQAAAISAGKTVTLGGTTTTANDLFNFTTLSVKTSDVLQSKTGEVFYAFSGQSGSELSCVRWNDDVITFYKGSLLNEDPKAAFSTVEK